MNAPDFVKNDIFDDEWDPQACGTSFYARPLQNSRQANKNASKQSSNQVTKEAKEQACKEA